MSLRKSQAVPDKLSFKVVKRYRQKQVKKSKTKDATIAHAAAKLLSPALTDGELTTDEEHILRPKRELRFTPLSDTSTVAFSYRGISYDFAQWPGNILRPRGPQPGFENFEDFLAHDSDEKCPPGCECRKGDDCPCVRNKTVCDPACQCAPTCSRRFVGCGCRDACSSSCWCHSKHRQCGEWCNCTNCGNDLDPHGIPRMRVQPSTIPAAGEGLFCLSKIGYKQYLGSYDGQKVLYKDKTAGVVMDFRISRTQCIRPDRDRSLLFKINYARPGEANIQFLTFETLSGRKVLAFAVTDILPGTELLAWYGPECSGNVFNHVPLTISPSPFGSRKFSTIIKENGTGYGIRPTKAWQEHASVLRWRDFKVGQDVFVNYKKSATPTDILLHISDARFIKRQLKRCWVGRIMEIRISTDDKARVVVVWYDRPASPPSDQSRTFELLGLHQLDVIDGDTLSSPAEVKYVKPGEVIPKDKLYYQHIHAKERLDPSRKSEIFLWADRKRKTGYVRGIKEFVDSDLPQAT